MAAHLRAAGFHVTLLGPDDAQDDHKECRACRQPLLKQHVAPQERALLLEAIETRETRLKEVTSGEFLVPFKRWILQRHRSVYKPTVENEEDEAEGKTKKKLHYILDGPNLAYINQNFDQGAFRFDQVDHVARLLQAQGHTVSITMPSPYLNEKSVLRLRTRKTKQLWKDGHVAFRTRTPLDKQVLDRWTQANMLFAVRTSVLSDDFFWLYASFLLGGRDCRVVTNDQGRDHVFALLNTKRAHAALNRGGGTSRTGISMNLIERWKDAAIVAIDIDHDDVVDPTQTKAKAKAKAKTQLPPPPPPAIKAVRLRHPRPYSRVPQMQPSPSHNDNPQDATTTTTTTTSMHFPVGDDQDGGWLCAVAPPDWPL